MTVLSDISIDKLCTEPYRLEDPKTSELICVNDNPMIDPFIDHLVRVNEQGTKIISYGLSSFGYDVRLSKDKIKLLCRLYKIMSSVSVMGRIFLIPKNTRYIIFSTIFEYA